MIKNVKLNYEKVKIYICTYIRVSVEIKRERNGRGNNLKVRV